jgi:hypothetical protein
VPANIGNPDFKVGLSNARGGAAVFFLFGPQAANMQILGVNIGVGVGAELVPGVLGGVPGAPGQGYGTLRVALPNEPALSGITLFTQWFVADAGVPAGGASSRGAEIRFF